MKVETFEAKYVRKIGIRRSLVEFSNGDCVFFDNQSRESATSTSSDPGNAAPGRSGTRI